MCCRSTLFSSSSDRKAHSSPTQPADAIRVASYVHAHRQPDRHRLRVIYSQTDTEAQTTIFEKNHILSAWLPFFYCDHRGNYTTVQLCVKHLPSLCTFIVYFSGNYLIYSAVITGSRLEEQACCHILKKYLLISTCCCKASAPPVIPHHVPACLVTWWWCSCGWLGPPLTRPPGWQTLRLGA